MKNRKRRRRKQTKLKRKVAHEEEDVEKENQTEASKLISARKTKRGEEKWKRNPSRKRLLTQSQTNTPKNNLIIEQS